MSTPDEVLEAALKLPAPERARVAHELLHSLDDGADADADAAWGREIERRARDVLDGKIALEDGDEVHARIAERLRSSRK